MHKRLYRRILLTLAVATLAGVPALADLATGFESPDYNGSAAGVDLTGQQGWYIPVADSNNFWVFTYAGNAFGVPPNPTGDEQFVAGERGDFTGGFARAQRDDTFAEDLWTVAFDICVLQRGDVPALDFVGSFSLQPFGAIDDPDSRAIILLYSWVDPNVATLWNAGYVIYDQWGIATDLPGAFPGPEWQNLELGTWYRLSNTIDFTQNIIVEVSITNLFTGDSTTVTNPIDPLTGDPYYLGGGANWGTKPLPSGYRLFTGGGTSSDTQPGNTTAWDNLDIGAAAQCEGDLDGDGDTDQSDLGILLGDWNCTANCVGDLDGDDDTDQSDLGILLGDWGCGT